MPRTSKYAITVDNISTATRSSDLEHEFKWVGKIRDLVKDSKARCALIEYERASDAEFAWKKMEGIMLHGRKLKVEWALPSDFKFFGWKWTEGSSSPSRSRSRTPPRTPAGRVGLLSNASYNPSNTSYQRNNDY